MSRVVASHILVSSEARAKELKEALEGGADFAALAKAHSLCPSGKKGGGLGTFCKGDMVPAFDKVVFGDLSVGQVSSPVKTQFGYHLIRVDARM